MYQTRIYLPIFKGIITIINTTNAFLGGLLATNNLTSFQVKKKYRNITCCSYKNEPITTYYTSERTLLSLHT